MIYPMMMKIDFGGLKEVAKRPKGLLVTLFVNWLVKSFSMAFFGWLFVQIIFSKSFGWIDLQTARNYTAGLIILAAAPCTAMVFVWSYLTDGDGPYTLAQVVIIVCQQVTGQKKHVAQAADLRYDRPRACGDEDLLASEPLAIDPHRVVIDKLNVTFFDRELSSSQALVLLFAKPVNDVVLLLDELVEIQADLGRFEPRITGMARIVDDLPLQSPGWCDRSSSRHDAARPSL